ncbi:MAG: phosphatase PAP2 family protein [Abyssibacter sp.]|jgi:membrane-associated phospholipid phosphatase|uniref:phosphatase PAP2 family protein n=1 Tax=Abyssibacter sp. TaxID=2320200 RepID=UPI0032195C59
MTERLMSLEASWLLLMSLALLLLLLRLIAGWIWRIARHSPRLAQWLMQVPGPRAAWFWASNRWPWLTGRLAARLEPRTFPGLPLTLLVLLSIYLASLGVGLLDDLAEGEDLFAWDTRINQALNSIRADPVVRVFAWITGLGNTETLAAVTLVAMGFLWADRRALFIPGLLLTIVGSQSVTWAGKFLVNRPRPEFLTFVEASSPSFPSAHATGALAVYGFVAYAIARDLRTPQQRFELGFWATMLVALIAASRMVLSVHFASDILAGLLVGGFWLLAGFTLTEWLRHHRRAAG